MRILVVEDELHLAEALTQVLVSRHYSVDAVRNGCQGLDCALSGIYDVIVLDIMLPGIDGLAILTTIRQEGMSTPVIFLTAKGELSDKVAGLDGGADDYLVKPFAMEELLARIRAVARRKGDVVPGYMETFGDIALNTATLKLSKNDREVKLSLKECELLGLLMARTHAVTSKELIIEKLWGFDSEAEYNNVEVYISFVRKKLAHLKSSVAIATIRGAGYILEVKC